MKRSLPPLPLLLLALLSSVPGPAAAQSPAALAAPKTPAGEATDLIGRLARGEYQAAAARFTETMRGAAPPEKLGELWTTMQAQMGTYQKQLGVRTEKQGEYDVAFVTTQFARSTVDFKVVVDRDGRIAGFFLVPPGQGQGSGAATPPPPYVAPSYVKKESFSERDAVVDADGARTWALPATLAIPAGAGPFPALVLVHGSGPNDRDETVEGNKTFRDLAWGLASRGIAVLRYEKRTRQHGSRLGTVKDFTVKEETVDDALAAAELLRRTPGIDPKRVFVLGHSLGGMLIPRIGQRDPHLAGLIVMAGAARPLEDIILEQVAYLAGTTPDAAAKQQIESLRAEVAKVKALKPGDTDAVLGAPASYWLDLRGYDPPAAAKALQQPLLILQGERDYQVTMDNLAAWKRALDGRPNVTFHTYPKLNHLFVAGEGKSLPKEYETPGHVDEKVIGDIAGWIAGRPRTGKD
jgi:dienelactone hydrolase